jgi:hypothetical protein
LTVWPDPVHGDGWISLAVAAGAVAHLRVYDLTGRTMAVGEQRGSTSGRQMRLSELRWTKRAAPGVYWLECNVDGAKQRRRFVILSPE